jgi:hypothetical protein
VKRGEPSLALPLQSASVVPQLDRRHNYMFFRWLQVAIEVPRRVGLQKMWARPPALAGPARQSL